MNVDLTPEQDELIRRAVESGRISHREEALQEAVETRAKREKLRDEFSAVLEKFRSVELADEKTRAAIDSLFQLVLGAISLEIDDDPFIAFVEWSGDADRKAYADL